MIMNVEACAISEREAGLCQSTARYASGRTVKPRNASATARTETITEYLLNTSHAGDRLPE
jgi:hypothetical protein